MHVKNGKVQEVTVDMGMPEILEESLDLSIADGTYTGTFVSMGNPHFVTFVDDMNQVNLPVVGPQLEHHNHFRIERISNLYNYCLKEMPG